ncbi:hypothetical protein NQZ79_g4891 [Umbelopsis isabellina]|nr:hypothetical protein NQZ79_g4891 [Umbelopsis isabellina]
MEDAHTTIPNLEKTGTSFFAVFDGHGADPAFAEKDYKTALKDGFLNIDQDLREDKEFANDSSGCTAVVALISEDNRVLVSNAGDSRAVISSHGKCKPLSYDHKPVNRTESSRIVAAGGFVEFGRVNGNLALSRALGDFEFKQNSSLPATEQIVTANPDIIEHKLGDEDEFMIIACDGIWDCKTNQEAVDFVRAGLGEKKTVEEICEELMDDCLAPNSEIGGVGCDNMTVVIVGILNGKTEDEWYKWMASRCQSAVAKKAEQDEAKQNEPIHDQDQEQSDPADALNKVADKFDSEPLTADPIEGATDNQERKDSQKQTSDGSNH